MKKERVYLILMYTVKFIWVYNSYFSRKRRLLAVFSYDGYDLCMIFGICTSMNARSLVDTGIDQAFYSKKIGLQYLELPVDRIMRLDDNRFNKFKEEIKECLLPCLSCNNFIDASIRLTGREYNRTLFENYIKKSLSRIASIGAKKVVFGSAKARSIPSYLSAEEGREQVIERIKYIAGIAEKHEIEIEIEHLNRMECNCINTFEESVAIAKMLNRPNVKSIFDNFHFELSGENTDLIRQNENWIGHIHFAYTHGRTMPVIDELKKMMPLLSIIRDCSYDNTFSIEAFFPGFEMNNPELKESILFMKNFLKKEDV